MFFANSTFNLFNLEIINFAKTEYPTKIIKIASYLLLLLYIIWAIIYIYFLFIFTFAFSYQWFIPIIKLDFN